MISQQNLSTPSRPFHLPPLSLPVQPLAEPILLGSDDEGEIDDPLRKDQLRRISHSAIEKRRREKIKDKIGVLRSIVPICSKQHTVNKLSILEHTITYIHYLKDLVVSYSEENAELRQMLDGQSYAAPDQAALPPAALPQPAYSSASGEHQPRHQQPQRHTNTNINSGRCRTTITNSSARDDTPRRPLATSLAR
ncbi:Myc-type, basic helix-loop-helix domain-containing protein [Polychytrium aggregatum]|uniref:Myc-type, basic helix-loop-helix domain-containing protein n=1 Tax=Polychytrium aggregatum TaxID=110093 RepID=UPI0022FF40D4|nr:Myc-type, basic helix-loop-helix domain-containing protein [Polychytrium aggregatum]KAI9199552.1 Myc-type, basic helix-loop-helix domain-containing protein [Polychytrium aggregatum]